MEIIQDNNKLQEGIPNSMEQGRDQEMTPSEVGTEDQELNEILERENLNLGKFLNQGTSKGIDSLPQEEFDRVQ